MDWDKIIEKYRPKVYGMCLKYTMNSADAEDLTQEVFLKAYSSQSEFDPSRGNLEAWLTIKAKHMIIDNFRRTKNLRITDSIVLVVDKKESPYEAAERTELENNVRKAVDTLSDPLKSAMLLRLQDLDYKTIAAKLGVPVGTVRSRIKAGRVELAKMLGPQKSRFHCCAAPVS